jgi:hypothetical protein
LPDFALPLRPPHSIGAVVETTVTRAKRFPGLAAAEPNALELTTLQSTAEPQR